MKFIPFQRLDAVSQATRLKTLEGVILGTAARHTHRWQLHRRSVDTNKRARLAQANAFLLSPHFNCRCWLILQMGVGMSQSHPNFLASRCAKRILTFLQLLTLPYCVTNVFTHKASALTRCNHFVNIGPKALGHGGWEVLGLFGKLLRPLPMKLANKCQRASRRPRASATGAKRNLHK